MKRLFKISSGEHGRGTVIVKWQPEGNLVATAGQNGNKLWKERQSSLRARHHEERYGCVDSFLGNRVDATIVAHREIDRVCMHSYSFSSHPKGSRVGVLLLYQEVRHHHSKDTTMF